MSLYGIRGVHGQTVDAIARRILSGALPEGATLDLAALQADFGVSLTVVREALKVLAAKGLVDARQKRGTYVRPRADWNLLDPDVLRWRLSAESDVSLLHSLDELRAIIEPGAVRLAAQRRTERDLAWLENALDAMSVAEDPSSAVEADFSFHWGLLSATHNELLERLETVLELALAAHAQLKQGSDETTDDSVPAHRAVFEGVRARDPDAAEAAMRALLDHAAAV